MTAEDAPETLKSDIAAAGIPESGMSAYTLQESWRALNDANLQHLSLLLHASSCWFRFSQVRRVFVRSTLTRASVRLARPTFLSLAPHFPFASSVGGEVSGRCPDTSAGCDA